MSKNIIVLRLNMYICVPAVKKYLDGSVRKAYLSLSKILQNLLYEVWIRMVALSCCFRSVLVHVSPYHVTPFTIFSLSPRYF